MRDYKPLSERIWEQKRAGNLITYVSDELTDSFRVKAWYCLRDALGIYIYDSYNDLDVWEVLEQSLGRIKGILFSKELKNSEEKVMHLLLNPKVKAELVLDVIEMGFRLIDSEMRVVSEEDWGDWGITMSPDDAISTLNQAFDRHDVGYQFEHGQLVPRSSTYMHQEVVEPRSASSMRWDSKVRSTSSCGHTATTGRASSKSRSSTQTIASKARSKRSASEGAFSFRAQSDRTNSLVPSSGSSCPDTSRTDSLDSELCSRPFRVYEATQPERDTDRARIRRMCLISLLPMPFIWRQRVSSIS